MSKTKMRCISCGKWFQSANAKEVTCPDCVQKARKEKMVAKTPPNTAAGQGANAAPRPVAPPPKPKSTQGGTNQWLDSLDDVKIGEPEQPPTRPRFPPSPAARDTRNSFSGRIPPEPDAPDAARNERGERGDRGRGPGNYRDDRGERGPGNYRDDHGERGAAGYGNYREGPNRGPGNYREGPNRGPGNYQVGGGSGIPGTFGQRPRQPMEGNFGPRPAGPGGENRFDRPRLGPGGPVAPGGPRSAKPGGARPKGKGAPRPVAPPKPKRDKIPPPLPFTPTTEQIAQVETRYLELSAPGEFDGIRTQISKELSIPKKAVKKIIKDLRDRQEIPSWWELQVYKGSIEELESIKKAYEPYLPLPPVGVHKNIAETLSLKPGTVYQAIKTIRQELNLPQYNDPTLHGLELKPATEQDTESTELPSAEAPSNEPQSTEPTHAEAHDTPAAEAEPVEPVTAQTEAPDQEHSPTPPETTPIPVGVAAQQEQDAAPVTKEESAPLEA